MCANPFSTITDHATVPQGHQYVTRAAVAESAQASPDRVKVFTLEAFDVHVEERFALCPNGQRSSNGSCLEEQSTGKVVFRIEWSNQHYLIGAACNLRRLFRRIAWLAEKCPIMANNDAMPVAG